jgi:dihydrofolate synthase/folylpolyglutamate synthase
LERIEERFAVDGRPCSTAELVALVDRVRPLLAVMDAEAGSGEQGARSQVQGAPPAADGPTFFEIVTAIALLHFVERQVDATVLEVGLGGRLDATNVCLPAVSVITSISFDHTKQLGHTLAAIAREKAGIVKPGVPVVSGVTVPEPQAVIAETAREHGCRLIQLGREFGVSRESGDCGLRIADCGLGIDFNYLVPGQEFELRGVPLAMFGPHQAVNAAVALAAICELRHQGWSISTAAMRDGLARTAMPGRVEVIGGDPTIVLDVAHNAASARALVAALAELPAALRRTLILSVSRDKDVAAIVAELAPHFDRVIVTQYQENPRAVSVEELAAIAGEWTPDVAVLVSPKDALAHARETAAPGELICIAGSFFLAAELRPLLVHQN